MSWEQTLYRAPSVLNIYETYTLEFRRLLEEQSLRISTLHIADRNRSIFRNILAYFMELLALLKSTNCSIMLTVRESHRVTGTPWALPFCFELFYMLEKINPPLTFLAILFGTTNIMASISSLFLFRSCYSWKDTFTNAAFLKLSFNLLNNEHYVVLCWKADVYKIVNVVCFRCK